MAVYTGGIQLEWREVKTGHLPLPRLGLRASLVDNIMFITGGEEFGRNNEFTSIVSWDPYAESWQPAGNLAVGRCYHAAVAVPSSIIESECSAML